MMGTTRRPFSVMVYSTRGGTSAKAWRLKRDAGRTWPWGQGVGAARPSGWCGGNARTERRCLSRYLCPVQTPDSPNPDAAAETPAIPRAAAANAQFADFALSPALLAGVAELNFTTPTAVQQLVLAPALDGQDVAGQAPTGSGKTAAYGLAVLQQVDPTSATVQAIVLVPARELVLQVRDALQRLGKHLPNLRVAGYYGGRTDAWLMRLTEIFQTIPFFLFAILLLAVLTPSIANVIIAIAVVSWPPMARLVRGEFLAMRDREFVLACVSMGMSNARIILRHILPNTLSSIIVTASLMVATAILIESSLSFLGLSDPNVMSWGFIIGAGRTAIRTAWWVCAIPGIAILLTVMSINLVGEGLNDALNPRLRTL